MVIDPCGIARLAHRNNFYKHANPPGLGIRSLLTKDAGGIKCLYKKDCPDEQEYILAINYHFVVQMKDLDYLSSIYCISLMYA